MTNSIENAVLAAGTVVNSAADARNASFIVCPPPNFWTFALIPGLLIILPLLVNLYLVIRGGIRRKQKDNAEIFPALLRISSAFFTTLALFYSMDQISTMSEDLAEAGTSGFGMVLISIGQIAALLVLEIPGIALGFIGAMILDLPKKSTGKRGQP